MNELIIDDSQLYDLARDFRRHTCNLDSHTPIACPGPALYWSQVTRAISTATTAIPAVATLRSRNCAVRKAPPRRHAVDFPEVETIGLLFG